MGAALMRRLPHQGPSQSRRGRERTRRQEVLAVGLDRADPLALQPGIAQQAAQARERMLDDAIARGLERVVALEEPQMAAGSECSARAPQQQRQGCSRPAGLVQHDPGQTGAPAALEVRVADRLRRRQPRMIAAVQCRAAPRRRAPPAPRAATARPPCSCRTCAQRRPAAPGVAPRAAAAGPWLPAGTSAASRAASERPSRDSRTDGGGCG